MAFNQTQVNSLHYGPNAKVGPALLCCEAFYRLGVAVRLLLYRTQVLKTQKLSVPVICVGNLTTGGTGKTPVVISLGQFLEARGLRVAVLSRGYGAAVSTEFHEANSLDYGDEPYLIQKQLKTGKVFVGKNRVHTGEQAIVRFRPDVILMDDGFQHLRLHRDLNILLVDGEHGFGNQHLLPAGPLREPLSEMSRAHWILLTRKPSPEQERSIRSTINNLKKTAVAKIAACPIGPIGFWHPFSQTLEPLASLVNHSLVLLSAIAQPAAFEQMVHDNVTAQVITHFALRDHQQLNAKSLEKVFSTLNTNADAKLITTDKDWVKLQAVLPKAFHQRVYVFRVEPVIDWTPILEKLSLPEKRVNV
jgi:tetraacyldisaccharide 4'-kinase